jgi:hypothetical protein
MLDCCNEGSQTPPPTLSPTPPPLTPTGSRLCSTYTVCVSEELGKLNSLLHQKEVERF